MLLRSRAGLGFLRRGLIRCIRGSKMFLKEALIPYMTFANSRDQIFRSCCGHLLHIFVFYTTSLYTLTIHHFCAFFKIFLTSWRSYFLFSSGACSLRSIFHNNCCITDAGKRKLAFLYFDTYNEFIDHERNTTILAIIIALLGKLYFAVRLAALYYGLANRCNTSKRASI